MFVLIDIVVFFGKIFNFVEEIFEIEEKMEVFVIECFIEIFDSIVLDFIFVDEEFEVDFEFVFFYFEFIVIWDSFKEVDIDNLIDFDFFGGIEFEKVFFCYELVDVIEEEVIVVIVFVCV